MNSETHTQLKQLGEKIATELVFAEPGKDLGLLPVNSLLGQIEELLAGGEAPESLLRGAQQARRWMDEIFDSTGNFSDQSLKHFGQWTGWWQLAVPACERQTASPPIPTWAGVESAVPAATPAPSDKANEKDEPALNLDLEQDGELLGEFINESREHLQNIEQGILVLEENPADADTLDSIFRAFHTFKGGSGFLNLGAIQSLAHELESLLDLARQHKLAITPAVIDLILEGGDTLKQFTDEITRRLTGADGAKPIVVPTLRLRERIRGLVAGGAAEPGTERGESGIPAQDNTRVSEQSNSAGKNTENVPEIAGATKASPTASAVKVDTLKLDSLIDLVGELVIAQSLVVQNPDLNALESEQLMRDLAQLGRISKDLQRTAMSLRMVPVRAMFQKMNRLVRDITAKVGKQVVLVTEGEDTELDRTIVEEISDPLIHMIRNSVDHGIEKPEARVKRGKPAQGTVSLKAFHQGGNIVIEIKDDGNGLDRDRILAKAIERGLVKPDEQPTDSQIFNLIMGAGFSTAEKITDISGRGVGMDVVRRNIERMRGKIEIQSTPGQGATFSIFLPLTLAIIDGLIVGVGEHRYIVPTLSVRESFQPAPDMIKTVQGRGEMVHARGKLTPLLRLHSHLGVTPATTDAAQSIVVVVESGNDSRCVLVDHLLGKQEVVIKSLGETFSQNRFMAGAAILGDGRVGLILDPQALVHFAEERRQTAA